MQTTLTLSDALSPRGTLLRHALLVVGGPVRNALALPAGWRLVPR